MFLLVPTIRFGQSEPFISMFRNKWRDQLLLWFPHWCGPSGFTMSNIPNNKWGDHFFVGFHIDVPHSNCSCKYSRHPCGCNMIESGLKSSLIDQLDIEPDFCQSEHWSEWFILNRYLLIDLIFCNPQKTIMQI